MSLLMSFIMYFHSSSKRCRTRFYGYERRYQLGYFEMRCFGKKECEVLIVSINSTTHRHTKSEWGHNRRNCTRIARCLGNPAIGFQSIFFAHYSKATYTVFNK